MSALVGVLVALAVVAAAGTRGRAVRVAPPARPVDRPARAGADAPLSTLLLGVCAQLRAGAAPGEAWSRATGAAAVGAVPTVGALLTATSRPSSSRFRGRPDDGAVRRIHAVLAAARLSDELGAPLAGVLERIASAVAADEEAEGERRAALAGPRATAQVLGWLPLVGVVLGALLGADPVTVVLSGGLGTASAAVGVTMLLVGRWWTAALLSRAGRAGEGGGGASRPGTSRRAAAWRRARRVGTSTTGGSPAGASRVSATVVRVRP